VTGKLPAFKVFFTKGKLPTHWLPLCALKGCCGKLDKSVSSPGCQMIYLFSVCIKRHGLHHCLLQERWLAKQQLDNLSCLSVSHFAFGRADYDFNDGLVHGRGHGGTVIYWSKNLKASSFSNCDGSIIGLRVF